MITIGRILSGEPEIEQWFDENYEAEADDTPLDIIDLLNEEEDFRADLSDILQEDMPKFIDFLQRRIDAAQEIDFEEDEEDTEELEQRASRLEFQINQLLGFNILGTPIR